MTRARVRRRPGLSVALVAALGLGPCLGALGCSEKRTMTTAATPRGGLRVPLPDGWVATPVGDRLEAGPAGRPALVLELSDAPLPTLDALLAMVVSERVSVREKESSDSFVAVSYAFGVDGGVAQPAFLAVKVLGARRLLCSSAAGAKPDEVARGLATCREVTREGAK